jgi:FAD:protein FMN transferase
LQIISNSVRRARPLLGTFVEIAVAGATELPMHAAVEAAFGAVAAVHDLMSFHEAASDVRRLNCRAWAGPVEVHPWTFHVIKAAIALHQRSAGVFDITVAPVLQAMGLLPCQARDRSHLHRTATMSAIELIPPRRVRFVHRSVRIDLGGIAKGFAVDRAVDVLKEHGMPRGLVNAGGDLAAFGPPEAIHVRDPRNPRRLMCRISVRDEALASSGNCFDALCSKIASSAIIDPSTGKRPRAIVGATVRAPSCMLADALTKVVMAAGPCATTLLERHRAGALIVSRNGTVQMTPDLESAVCLAA